MVGGFVWNGPRGGLRCFGGNGNRRIFCNHLSRLNSKDHPKNNRMGVAMRRTNKVGILLTGLAVFAAVVGSAARPAAGSADDKYSLKTTSGIAFADFKGYEDWAVISSARTDEVLKVIVGNSAMVKAYKSGVPLNGQVFPDGSRVAKLQWKPKNSTEAPFVAGVCDGEGQQEVSEDRRVGICVVQLRRSDG